MAQKKKTVDTSLYWHILLPVLCLLVLVTFFYVVYTMPDWFLSVSPLFPQPGALLANPAPSAPSN